MATHRDLPTRHEVTEKISMNKREMEVKEINLDKVVSDLETVRKTLENLDLGGTSDGTEQVEGAIESAKDVTKGVFDREDQSLEETQARNEEFEGKLQEHRESSEADREKISDASAKIETKETINELSKAKEAVLREIDFLAEQLRRAKEARKGSDDTQEKLQARVHAGGKER